MEKKIRKNGLVRLNAAGVAKAESLSRGGRYDSAIWGKSRCTEEDDARYRANIQKRIAEAEAAGKDTWSITMQDDGEPRLMPTTSGLLLQPGPLRRAGRPVRKAFAGRRPCRREWSRRRRAGCVASYRPFPGW